MNAKNLYNSSLYYIINTNDFCVLTSISMSSMI